MPDTKRIYRALLRLYPARFREEYSAPMERLFDDEYRQTPGRADRLLLYLRVLADLTTSIPAQIAQEMRLDLHYALRVYRRRRVATALALTALALAIGATTGVFSVVNALALRSLPFLEPARLVQLENYDFIEIVYQPLGLNRWLEQTDWWQDAAAYRSADMNLSRTGQAVRVQVTETTPAFFTTLGAKMHFGRPFAADEFVAGKDGVAVIGYGLWQQLFGGDPRVLGAAIRLNGVRLTVIGVAAPGLDYPGKTAVWTPTYLDPQGLPRSTPARANAIGRLKPGMSLAQAASFSRAEFLRICPGQMAGDRQYRPRLISLQEHLAGPVRQASMVLLAVVAFVLLIACANVAQLLLSRITGRQRELAIRAALGASRARLAQQLITESMVLTMAASTAGLAVAHVVSRLCASALPPALSAQQYTTLDWRVLGFSATVAVLIGLIFGVLPASLIGRMQPAADSVRGASAPVGMSPIHTGLVILQTAFTVVLVAGAFTMGRAFLKLAGTDLGLQPNSVVTLRVSLLGSDWEPDPKAAQYVREAIDRLRAVPGVESAGAGDYLPLLVQGRYLNRTRLDSGQELWYSPISVTSGYFRAMGTGMVEGRDFTDADRLGSAPVAIVNEEFVRRAQARSSLIGRTATSAWAPPYEKPFTIVGVVRNTRRNPSSEIEAQFYTSAAQLPPDFATFVARVRGEPERYLASARDAVRQVDPQVPVYDVKTLDRRLRDALAKPQFYTEAVFFFGFFALLLTAIGIYGVASHSVVRRTHEIGVRIALGAAPEQVQLMLLRQGLAPVLFGLVAGVAAAVGFGRFLNHLLESAQPVGVSACAAAGLGLLMVAAVAVWSASLRVTWMDPGRALRAE
jgi:putative ABC transport system permease protein